MEIVLGVSMTSSAVRMVLVEGERADGAIVDRAGFDIPDGPGSATTRAVEQVVAAILGTRESAADGGHRLICTGVAWNDHDAAAELTRALRSDDVVLVSELHAASALAQAVGRTIDAERTALLFLERDTATCAVVRTDDGAVVSVTTRALLATDPAADLSDMVTALETLDVPPQAVFLVGSGGSGVDVATLRERIEPVTSLPVHAPEDAEVAMARGAALASAGTPRYEAATVGLSPGEDAETAAGLTQLAAAGYMAPLGYSAVPDEPDPLPDPGLLTDRRPFLLAGSALVSVFVIGVTALAISLAVTIRPTVDQRPDPGRNPVVPSATAPAGKAGSAPSGPAPETIQAPVPVVQEAPRTVVVTPPRTGAPVAVVPAPAPVAPAPAAPAPAPAPAAPAPAPAPAAPAPYIPPIVVAPILPPLLPPLLRPPVRSSVPQLPATQVPTSPAPTTSYPTYTPPATPPATTVPSYPTYTATPTTGPSYPTYTQAPDYGDVGGDDGSGDSGSSGRSAGTTSVWPLWPFSR